MGGYPQYCVQCGSGLTSDTRFCGNCGYAALADAAPPSFAAPPTGPAYPPPPDRPVPPPARPAWASGPSHSPPPAQYAPPPPAQYALPAGSSAPPPSPPAPGETAKFGTSWLDEVGFNPQWEQAPPGLPPITDDRSADDRPRQSRPLVIGLVALLAAVFVVPALLIVHAFHGLGGSHAAAAEPTSSKPAPSASATPTERAAATALAALLAQSVTDRDAIVRAVGAVNQCTSGLSQAPQAFQDAATSRQRLLQQLDSLPGRSALPAAMVQELTGAWQASATVDEDLGKWAQDELSSGCHRSDHADANFEASNAPDVQATNDKTAFVATWDPIAAKYGLTRYSTSQL